MAIAQSLVRLIKRLRRDREEEARKAESEGVVGQQLQLQREQFEAQERERRRAQSGREALGSLANILGVDISLVQGPDLRPQPEVTFPGLTLTPQPGPAAEALAIPTGFEGLAPESFDVPAETPIEAATPLSAELDVRSAIEAALAGGVDPRDIVGAFTALGALGGVERPAAAPAVARPSKPKKEKPGFISSLLGAPFRVPAEEEELLEATEGRFQAERGLGRTIVRTAGADRPPAESAAILASQGITADELEDSAGDEIQPRVKRTLGELQKIEVEVDRILSSWQRANPQEVLAEASPTAFLSALRQTPGGQGKLDLILRLGPDGLRALPEETLEQILAQLDVGRRAVVELMLGSR